MIGSIINPLLEKLSDVAIDKWHNHQSFVNARLAIRDRLRRESKLNSELLYKIKGKKYITCELSTKALQEVFEMPIPLKKVLDKSLAENVKNILCKNKNYKNWTENIHTESELVERLWQRTKMLEIHVKTNQGKPNVNYVCILNRALALSLEQ